MPQKLKTPEQLIPKLNLICCEQTELLKRNNEAKPNINRGEPYVLSIIIDLLVVFHGGGTLYYSTNQRVEDTMSSLLIFTRFRSLKHVILWPTTSNCDSESHVSVAQNSVDAPMFFCLNPNIGQHVYQRIKPQVFAFFWHIL